MERMDVDFSKIPEEYCVEEMVASICSLMFEYGYREINIGHLLRLIGVSDENAEEFDDTIMVLDDSVDTSNTATTIIPKNTTIH